MHRKVLARRVYTDSVDIVDIRLERTTADREAALRIRKEVFVIEQSIPQELDDDGKDEHSVHVLAFDGNKAIGTARLSSQDNLTGTISRVAVLPGYRGSGLGERLVAALEGLARQKNLIEVSLEPHQHLEAFYQGLGFERVGGTSRAGDHILITMRKTL